MHNEDDYLLIDGARSIKLYGCKRCGVVVYDTEKHDGKHANDARVAENARWGGMLRPIG
jgi:hypothetical protein